MGFFNKKNKITIEEYAYYNLYIINQRAESFFNHNNEFLKFDIYSEIAYYTFFTYIVEKILSKKYSLTIIDKITRIIMDRMIELQYQDITPKTEDSKITLQDLYNSCYNKLKSENFDFNKKEDLYNMSKTFLQILDIPENINYIMKICTEFSAFITFHTQDILKNDIELV